MFAYILRRLVPSMPIIAFTVAVVFIGIYISPDQAAPVAVACQLAFDLPFYQQSCRFVANTVYDDLGNSFVQSVSVLQRLFSRLPAISEIAFGSITIAFFFGILPGMWTGLKPDRIAGKTIMSGLIAGSIFWVGLTFILLFAVTFGWVPSRGSGETRSLFGLPVSFLTNDQRDAVWN